MKSVAVAVLLLAAVAACGQQPVEPTPVAAVNPAIRAFQPYCGPVWSVPRQGYVNIPCPTGTSYDTIR
jgi:hypothetical protein